MNADYLEIRQAYLAHYKTKGAKKGIRRFQSYEVAPNPSGYVGQEVGEAAAQSRRVGDDDNGEESKDPKKQIENLKSSYGKLTDEFTKKHPKAQLHQFDDWDLIDMYTQDPKDPESREFQKEYGFDVSAIKDYKTMRVKQRAIDKQIKDLTPKKRRLEIEFAVIMRKNMLKKSNRGINL